MILISMLNSKVIAADFADMAKHLMVDRSEQEEVRGARQTGKKRVRGGAGHAAV